jgi:hypothetical protein
VQYTFTHMRAGNKLRHIRGRNCVNSSVSGGHSSCRDVCVVAVGQVWPENGKFATPVQQQFHDTNSTHFSAIREHRYKQPTNSFSNATNESCSRPAAFNLPPAAHIDIYN